MTSVVFFAFLILIALFAFVVTDRFSVSEDTDGYISENTVNLDVDLIVYGKRFEPAITGTMGLPGKDAAFVVSYRYQKCLMSDEVTPAHYLSIKEGSVERRKLKVHRTKGKLLTTDNRWCDAATGEYGLSGTRLAEPN